MLGPVLFLLTCVGLVCLVRGIVGKRVGETPRCAGCGYDLSGVELEVDFCPECGRAIGPASSVLVGRRRPIWPLVLAGAVLTTAGLGGVAVSIWSAATGFDWIRTRSFSSLVRPAETGPAPREVDELIRRLSTGLLSRSEAERFVRALAARRSTSALWLSQVRAVAPLLADPELLDVLHIALVETYDDLARDDRANPDAILLRRVIEAEYSSGRLRGGADYFRTMIDVVVEVDPVVSGRPARIRYAVAFRQLPAVTPSPRAVVVDLDSATPGFEVVFPAEAKIQWDLAWHIARARGEAADWVVGRVETDLPAGRYELRLEARVVLRGAPPGRPVELTIPVRHPVSVLPPGTEIAPTRGPVQ